VKLLLALLVVYLLLLALAVLVSERAIFLPPPPSYRAGGDVVELTARDGVGIAAVHLPAPPDVRDPFTLLYSHGNAEDLGHARPWLEALRAMGFAVLAYDYRGYGASDRVRTTEQGVYRDIDAAYDYLTGELGVAPGRIILFGRSVGAGPTLDLAVRREAAGIILDSPFTSAFRVVTRVPLFPFDRFPNLRRIRRVDVPVLVIHGTRDEVIPIAHGRAIHAAAPGPTRALWVEGGRHNDVHRVAGATYERALLDFAELVRSGG
jgi:abhydrolase domain-containing protein 17